MRGGTRKGKSIPWISEFPTKSIGYAEGWRWKERKKKKGGGEAQKASHTRAPRDSWRNVRQGFLFARVLAFFSAKKIYHVCRGCTRPRDKRGGVCRGKRDWKFCGPASFAHDPVFYCVQVKLICSYFLYSTSRRKEQLLPSPTPLFLFPLLISLSIIFHLISQYSIRITRNIKNCVIFSRGPWL